MAGFTPGIHQRISRHIMMIFSQRFQVPMSIQYPIVWHILATNPTNTRGYDETGTRNIHPTLPREVCMSCSRLEIRCMTPCNLLLLYHIIFSIVPRSLNQDIHMSIPLFVF
jgi:hypothetical protein